MDVGVSWPVLWQASPVQFMRRGKICQGLLGPGDVGRTRPSHGIAGIEPISGRLLEYAKRATWEPALRSLLGPRGVAVDAMASLGTPDDVDLDCQQVSPQAALPTLHPLPRGSIRPARGIAWIGSPVAPEDFHFPNLAAETSVGEILRRRCGEIGQGEYASQKRDLRRALRERRMTVRTPAADMSAPQGASPSCKEDSRERPLRMARSRKRGPFSGGSLPPRYCFGLPAPPVPPKFVTRC